MTKVPGDRNYMLHAICHSTLFQNACKNYPMLKQYSIVDASIWRKFIADFCQDCSE